MHVGARGERLQQPPLGGGQVLEAVREDGARVPGVELAGQPPDRVPAKRSAIRALRSPSPVPFVAET